MMDGMHDDLLVTTRLALHALAALVISPLRVRATGNEIALQVRPGGFGTPELPGGGWVGVSGTDVVVVEAVGDERRTAIATLRAAGAFVGLDGADALPDDRLEVHSGAATILADAFARGDEALRALIDATGPAGDPSGIHLWPEHFDIAIDLGAADARATYGVSPGDERHVEPYAYVAPFSTPPESRFWNATGFPGAERPADDPDEITAFWLAAHQLLSPHEAV
ncbi:MAG: hypothetical protein JWP53_138 [Conexibacter sp.]|nr:hypothetical protein [Conexibacter sp.]